MTSGRSIRHRVAGLASVLLLVGLTACHTPPAKPSRAVATTDSDLQRHVVSSEQLRVIMRRMESLTVDRMQSELELDKKRRGQADELAQTAATLARTAMGIPGALDDKALDAADRLRFREFAEQLQRDAAELQRLASEGQLAAADAQFERMRHACAGCHSIYRPRRGEL